MSIFRSSDWHLGHVRILELCDRPFKDVNHMNQQIIERCNDVVTEKDTLVLHGDNVMGRYLENLELLRSIRAGTLILLPGNHDRWSIAYTAGEEKREAARLVVEETLTSHFETLVVSRDREPSTWWHRGDGRRYAISHYPYESADDPHDKGRYASLKSRDEGLPLVHGHVHGAWRENGRMLNVGVDVWNFTPVSEDQVNAWLDTLT